MHAQPTAVAVVGMGVAVPGASDPEELWTLLNGGEPVFTEPGDRFPLRSFWSADPAAPDRAYARRSGYIADFRPHPLVAAELDAGSLSQADHGLLWLRHALAQARDGSTVLDGDRCGFYVGATADNSQHVAESAVVEAVAHGMAARLDGAEETVGRLRAHLRSHYRHTGDEPRTFLPDRLARSAASGLLPEDQDVVTVDAACASSLFAIDWGVRALLAGECQVAYCGGVYAMTPRYNVVFSKLGGLSRSGGVRAFDDKADGTLFSDGAAVLALKGLERAHDDGDAILGVISGFGASSDGAGRAIHAPNPSGQRLAVERARSRAGITAKDLDWVLAHGTGTAKGDAVELEMLGDLAPPSGHPCTSNKSLLGHCGWSAGAVSAVHALLALEKEKIPAQHPLGDPPGTSAAWVPREPVRFPRPDSGTRTAAVSAFGFGGVNGHLIVQDDLDGRRRRPSAGTDDPLVMVGWSAILPGDPPRDEVKTLVREGAAPPVRGFADRMLTTSSEARLPPPVLRSIDRSQHLAFEVAAAFVAEHGEIWAPVRDSTGVLAATMGPTRLSIDNLVRCYAEDLGPLFEGREAEALNEYLDHVRDTTPETSSHTLPGILPNVTAARLAARYDLHGTTLAVDLGAASGLAAVRTAAMHLADGDLDLALLLGVNADSGPDLASLVDVAPDRIAEGAFLVAISRRSTAVEHRWPMLARISQDGESAETRLTCGEQRASYLGADGVARLIQAVHLNSPEVTLTGPRDDACRPITVAPAPAFVTRRFALSTRPKPGEPVRQATPALPPGVLVLTDSEEIADGLEPAVDAVQGRVLVAGGRTEALTPAAHVRVISSVRRAHWPSAPARDLLRLQELAFRSAVAGREMLKAGGSYAALVLDRFSSAATHPHAALLAGTVRSLATELRGCGVFAVISDAATLDEGLRELEIESRMLREVQDVRMRGGVREGDVLTPVLEPEPAPSWIDDDSTIVAVGGARGITAAALLELTERHRPRLWLLGSTDLDATGAAGPSTMAELLRAEPHLTVPQARGRLEAEAKAEEVRRTLQKLRGRCGHDRVTYLACDVTDPAAIRAAADRIHSADTTVDLLINAAGIIRPNSLERKVPGDFRQVRDVKVLGYHHLKQVFAPRRWCNFGSMSGTVSLPGQSDYDAANCYLAAAARFERAHGAGGEQTIAWPIWADVGMAADLPRNTEHGVSAHFTQLPVDEGVTRFMTEVLQDPPGLALSAWLGDLDLHTIARESPGLLRGPEREEK